MYALVWASGLDGWRVMDSFQALMASSYSSVKSLRRDEKEWVRLTEVVVRNPQVE
jgi:hypothetical protein